MAPQSTEQITASAPVNAPTSLAVTTSLPSRTDVMRHKDPLLTSNQWWWLLLAVGAALNVCIVILGTVLFFGPKTIEKYDATIQVPYATDKQLLDLWRAKEIQVDGRTKPFGTFAIESVRTIYGREKLEIHVADRKKPVKVDPVAVVLSWMLSSQSRAGDLMRPATLVNLPRTTEVREKLGCQWDDYPFIWCDFHELREEIYREEITSGELTLEQKQGKHIEPARLRKSLNSREGALHKYAREIEELSKHNEKPKLSMIQNKAQSVITRLHLYDRIQAGMGFAIVSLDRVGGTWFRPAELEHWSRTEYRDHRYIGRSRPVLEWNRRMTEARERDAEGYQGTPFQAYPAAAVADAAAAWQNMKSAYLTGDEERFYDASEAGLNTITEVSRRFKPEYPESSTTQLELLFNRVVPFQKAWIFCLLGTVLLACSVLVWNRFFTTSKVLYYGGLGGFILGLGYAAFGFFCRVSISGRPPISDMYETIIWVSSMTGLFGLILEFVYRRGYIALAASVVSTLGYVLADQLPTVFSPNIQPLNAVLRSQYWLIVHVITIVSSYAAFALAWGIGNINLGLIVYTPERQDLIKTLSNYAYKAIQIGVILLFFGTMLGGWWAAESWGRFWGWDPKEVWALIAFVCYIIPLHARYIGWVKDFGLAASSVVCFAAVVMAWYGVNFVLGAGLHSYGFGSGNNRWVYFAGLINISLVVHAAMRYVGRGSHLATAE